VRNISDGLKSIHLPTHSQITCREQHATWIIGIYPRQIDRRATSLSDWPMVSGRWKKPESTYGYLVTRIWSAVHAPPPPLRLLRISSPTLRSAASTILSIFAELIRTRSTYGSETCLSQRSLLSSFYVRRQPTSRARKTVRTSPRGSPAL
jgi:hypothetical protein